MSEVMQFYNALKSNEPAQARQILRQARSKKTVSDAEIDRFEDGLGPADPDRNGNQPKKRAYTRRPKSDAPKAGLTLRGSAKGPVKTNTVQLSPDQMVRLWSAVTGGKLIIDDTGDLAFHVSFDSLQSVIPALLERL